MLKDAPSNLFQVVLVWKINRFSRRNSDLLNTVEKLGSYNINLVSCCEQFDASTPPGKLMLSMLGSIGEFERDNIVENIRSGMVERASQGLFNGGRLLGYDMSNGKLAVNPKESSIVRKIFSLYLSGVGYKGICRILKDEGMKTKNNCCFEVSSVKRILTNPVYAGYITYNKAGKRCKNSDGCTSIMVKGIHEPIVSKQDFDEVQNIIGSKRQSYISSNTYMLSPFLKCPQCGGKMTGHTGGVRKDGTRYRYYVCINYKNYGARSCGANCINADYVEGMVMDYIVSIVSRPGISKDVYKKILEAERFENRSISMETDWLKKELSNRNRTLHKYISLFEGRGIDLPILEDRVKAIYDEIEKLKMRQSELESMKNPPCPDISCDSIYMHLRNFKHIFKNLNSTDKNRILSSLIREIHFDRCSGTADIITCFPILS